MTARYLLATNIVSTLAEEPRGRLAQKALAIGEARLATSIVVACELRFGAVRVGSARLEAALNAILGAMPVLPLEPGVEQHYAEIRSALERRGKPIGANDLLIAAHARSIGATLVTRNEREFRRVPGLDVESWR
ncbi:MAG: type II toxin-antitoxin system VapC family toxin [Myxococcales bacterium]|nr:type II toxin-antitoxin system VapC family toxin [Myxococcales bacterium]